MNRLLELLWVQPARIVALSFVLVALVAAMLMMLPPAHTEPDGLTFLDAFFTAASAVCVTGLIVVDTPVAFTLFGEIVILVLIQIGGLGIMAFSLSAIFLRRKRLSVGESELLSYMLNEEDRTTLRGQLLSIVGFTFLLELIGAALLYLPMRSAAGDHSAIWLSVFHAVSAFCNAGFSLFSDSLVQFADHLVVNATIGGLIIAGGIGFTTMTVFRDDIDAWLRHIMPGRWAGKAPRIFRTPPAWRYVRSESSRIALRGTAVLLVLGAVLFYVLETGHILADEVLASKYIRSIFQSVTLRTAGFNTVDIAALSTATLLMMVPFMFIGAGSGGTAGGVKLGTVAVVLADVKRFVFGREDAVLFYRRVPR
nr:TrkH family potassium uptake protein [Spirochaeta sp.]